MSILKYLTPRPYLAAYHERNFDPLVLGREEEAKFASWNFDVGKARGVLDDALAALERHAYRVDKDSVHWLLFACLSLTTRPERILELGTFDGGFTAILARLFPDASIITIDLPESDPLLRSTYERGGGDELELYRRVRAANLEADNVEVLERNSMFLLEQVTGPFDLVWVDDGHVFPEVAWDMANAWHLCREGGFVLSDDVVVHPQAARRSSGRVSHDGYTTLRYLEERVPGDASLFLKRRGKRYAADPRRRKYVSLMQKHAGDRPA
jgi:predicted O-methyltransferase YrrM